MKIPKSFKVGKVKFIVNRPDMLMTFHARGYFHSAEKQIGIAKLDNTNGRKLTEKEVTHTFWHEAVHAMLHDMQSKLTYDEVFVDALAKRMTEVIYTAKF
jgi:hypothetical protein